MRDKILLRVLIALGIFNLLDYLFTLRAVYILGVPEANPVMDMALGSPWFAIVKLFLVPLGLYFIWRHRHKVDRLRSLIAGILLFVTAAYAGVTLWHIYAQLFMYPLLQ